MIRRLAGPLLLLHAVACTHRGQLSADASELARGQAVSARTASGDEVEGTVVKGPLGSYVVHSRGEAALLGVGVLGGIGVLVGAAGGAAGGASLEYAVPAQYPASGSACTAGPCGSTGRR